jgi:hypothetical protein
MSLTTVYSTVLILGLSLNFGQFDKLIASKLLISFPVNLISQSLIHWSLPPEALTWYPAGGVLISVKIGKNSARNQSKALIPQSKNKIFQRFLTHFPKKSYERRATRNGYIFVSKALVALIIEGVFFYSLSLPKNLSPGVLTRLFCRGPGTIFSPPAKKMTNTKTLNLSSNVVVRDPDYNLII